jgi:transcriptional regulator NrdR family protein
MVCIYCRSNTRVVNKRDQKRINNVWRRRQCTKCQAVFTSIESPLYSSSWSISYNGKLRPFSREKLFLSILRSCEHRKNSLNDTSALVDQILFRLSEYLDSGTLTIESIKSCAAVTLNRFDKVASTHYQAIHR